VISFSTAGEMVPMETALLASPEGRSFVSYLPMPFRKGARIVVANESGKPVNLIFYDVDYRALRRQPKDALYFHAWRSRDRTTALGRDFRILPRILISEPPGARAPLSAATRALRSPPGTATAAGPSTASMCPTRSSSAGT
jgi:hypothetical protein